MWQRWTLVPGIVIGMILAPGARAADPITVDSLLADGYQVAAAVPSPIGPGLFLQKAASLYSCFVAEKPGSPALTTVYCKAVH